MTLDRRGFVTAGTGFIAAGTLAMTAEGAQAAPAASGRSITEFGAEPNSEADQTAALQKAIDEISASGNTVYIPGGAYRVETLILPPRCAIRGDAGHSMLRGKADTVLLASARNEMLSLSGLILDGSAEGQLGGSTHLLGMAGGSFDIHHCLIRQTAGGAIRAEGSSGMISACTLHDLAMTGIVMAQTPSIIINQCRIERSLGGGAIEIAVTGAKGEAALITGNHLSLCANGVILTGSGMVTGNVIAGVRDFGLRLGGGGDENGAISATGNSLRDCSVGIGVSASGETIFAAHNLISRAKMAAIRAFDGNDFVGPDLAVQSAEHYLNLTLIGNVAR